MPAPKGHPRYGGRKKGTANKITSELREAIQNAFMTAGGEAYLVKVAKKSPAVFCKLLGMTLPKDVNLNAPGGLSISIAVGDEARRTAKP